MSDNASIVQAWYDKHISNSPISRRTDICNPMMAAKPSLVGMLDAGVAPEFAVTNWANGLNNAPIAHDKGCYEYFVSILPSLIAALTTDKPQP